MEIETLKEGDKKVEKSFSILHDPWYLSDLSDKALIAAYDILHEEYEKIPPSTPAIPRHLDTAHYLKSEIIFRHQFSLRSVAVPKKNDSLSVAFSTVVGTLSKQENEGREAVTTEDPIDDHVHTIKDLDSNGDGATEEAGNPPHTHNVSNFLVLPVELENYKSEHPGKVILKREGNFKVTKRHDNGLCEWQADFSIFKVDEDQHLVGGIIYEPDVVDAQGDSATASEIVKAAHNWMIKSQTLGKMHKERLGRDKAVIVESFIAPSNYLESNQIVRKGSWILVEKILDKKLWQDVKEGKYTGFSMAGRAKDGDKVSKSEKKAVGIETYIAILEKGLDLEKVLRQESGKWCVYSADGKRKIACHGDKEDAIAQLRAIEANKQKTEKHLSETELSKNYQITVDEMKSICGKCHTLMKKKGIKKVKIGTLTNRNKFKRVFGIRRSTTGHTGLCRKYCSDPVLFKREVSKKG